MMFCWIWEVPAAIVYESEDSRSAVQLRDQVQRVGAEHVRRRVVELLARAGSSAA